jgi:hypothetical protein
MGVAGAWTVSSLNPIDVFRSLTGLPKDWHIDFAGSSVYYHILRGSKVILFLSHRQVY